jgi:hypothetical protein
MPEGEVVGNNIINILRNGQEKLRGRCISKTELHSGKARPRLRVQSGALGDLCAKIKRVGKPCAVLGVDSHPATVHTSVQIVILEICISVTNFHLAAVRLLYSQPTIVGAILPV